MSGVNTYLRGAGAQVASQAGAQGAAPTQGLDALKQTNQTHAQQVLLDLRDHLRNKTGVLRLLHTSKDDKEMKFKTAGSLRARWFVDGTKLQRSGQAVRALMAQAGMSAQRLADFDKYLSDRGTQGVQAQVALDYLNELLPGQGAASGSVGLSTKFSPALTSLVALRSAQGTSAEEAMAKLGVDLSEKPEEPMGHGGFGDVFALRHRGEDFVYKESNQLGWDEKTQSHSIQQPMGKLQTTAEAAGAAGAALARSGLGATARVKADLPQVVTPAVYVLRSSGGADGADQFHAVSRGYLKTWARTQPAGSEFAVIGYAAPRAAGRDLIEYDDDQDVSKVNVKPESLKPMARSAIELLKGLGSHGFVHGDIKPSNLFWNERTKTLQAIDTDAMTKVSKRPGSAAPIHQQGTQAYLNPVAFHPAYAVNHGMWSEYKPQLGAGRDLYATGLSLLEAAMYAKGRGSEFEALVNALSCNGSGKDVQAGKYQAGIELLRAENFEPDSIEDFARTCVLKSIDYELNRVNRGDRGFERYDPNADKHLLNEISRHPALNGV